MLNTILRILSKSNKKVADNPPVRIYVNKIENMISFEIKTGCYLELLTLEKMTLRGSTYIKINEDRNGENFYHLKITEVLLVYCNIVNNNYEQDS